jgi:hypothetical protein
LPLAIGLKMESYAFWIDIITFRFLIRPIHHFLFAWLLFFTLFFQHCAITNQVIPLIVLAQAFTASSPIIAIKTITSTLLRKNRYITNTINKDI